MEVVPVTLLLLLIIGVVSSEEQLCDVCQCGSGFVTCSADATNRGLPLPPEIEWPSDSGPLTVTFNGIRWEELLRFPQESSVKSLFLNNNGITSILSSAFSGLKNLKELSITNNRLSHINYNSFKDLRKLTKLDLSNNNLYEITGKDVEDLESLEKLIIQNNELSSIPNEALKNLNKLTSLHLSGNRLFEVKFEDFIIQLKHIDLSLNKLSIVSKDSFPGAHALEILNLSDNDLSFINKDAFTTATSLQQLNLSNNKLKELPTLPDSLQMLIVNHNSISNWMRLPSELTYLDISHNSLYDIPEKDLELLTLLNTLILSNNELKSLTIDKPLMNITTLDISYNKLEEIPDSINSDKLPALEFLDISGNLIKTLKFNRELNLRVLEATHLSLIEEIKKEDLMLLNGRSLNSVASELEENEFCIKIVVSHCANLGNIENATFQHLPLCHLDLSHNNLKYLSEDVANWRNVSKGVNLQNNPWHCDCNLQWFLDTLLDYLYDNHSDYLHDLRCESDKGTRLVHWYQQINAFCDNFNYHDQYAKILGSKSEETVSIASSGIVIGMLVSIVVLSIVVIVLTIYLIRGKSRHDRKIKRLMMMRKRQSAADAKRVSKDANQALTSV